MKRKTQRHNLLEWCTWELIFIPDFHQHRSELYLIGNWDYVCTYEREKWGLGGRQTIQTILLKSLVRDGKKPYQNNGHEDEKNKRGFLLVRLSYLSCFSHSGSVGREQ